MSNLVSLHLFDYHCDGMLEAVRKAAAPAKYPAGHVMHDYEPYYGELVGRAVWEAQFVMREARRLGLLEPEQVAVLLRLDIEAGDPVPVHAR